MNFVVIFKKLINKLLKIKRLIFDKNNEKLNSKKKSFIKPLVYKGELDIVNKLNSIANTSSSQRYILKTLGDGTGSKIRVMIKFSAICKILDIKPIFIWQINEACGGVENIDKIFKGNFSCIGCKKFNCLKFNESFVEELNESNIDIFISKEWKGKKIFKMNKDIKIKSIIGRISDLNEFGNFEELNIRFNKEIKKITSSLKFVPDITIVGDEFINNKFNGKVLGVHVRGGDARVKDYKQKIFDINKCIKLIKEIEGEFDTIFLSVEDKDQLELFIKEFPEKVVFFDKDFFGNRMNYQAGLIEMYLLSKCSFIIKPESYFSLLAAEIGEVPYVILSLKKDVDIREIKKLIHKDLVNNHQV